MPLLFLDVDLCDLGGGGMDNFLLEFGKKHFDKLDRLFYSCIYRTSRKWLYKKDICILNCSSFKEYYRNI